MARLLCVVYLCHLAGGLAELNPSGYEPKQDFHVSGETADGQDSHEWTQPYPFNNVYYSYTVQSNELVKDAKLNPSIAYKTSKGYRFTLEPITQFCRVDNTSIFTKFSVIRLGDNIHVNVDENLTLTNDSTIVYKLKAFNKDNLVNAETTVVIRVVRSLPIPDTTLEFDEPSYSIKLSYGRKGKVFRFKSTKKSVTAAVDENAELKFGTRPVENDSRVSHKVYPFGGNYSLEYVTELLMPMLRVNQYGDLEVIGNIDEGIYDFDVVAVDYGPGSSTLLKARSKVHLFVYNVAVCSSKRPSFIKAFSKHYLNEETKLHTVVPATGTGHNCSFVISHQYPLGADYDEYFGIDPETGAVHVVKPVDREAYPFEDMDEPSVYLRLAVQCPPTVRPAPVQPLRPYDFYNIAYDPSTTLVQLIVQNANDNAPTFVDRCLTVGYPVPEVAAIVPSRHLVQVKATDKDAEKHDKIHYSLRGRDAQDFVINSETGTVYCARPANGSGADRTFEVVATDNNGKPGGLETSLPVTVKPLTFAHVVRVNVGFSTSEDRAAVEAQLSDISGVRVMSLADDVVANVPADGQWRTERTLTVYGLTTDGSLVLAADLEKKLAGNAKILKISVFPEKNDGGTSGTPCMVYAALFCLMLSLVAMALLYFGYVKNGRYMSCVSSTSTTPLKDDMGNILNQFSTNVCRSQNNWIMTLNGSNISSGRVRFPSRKVDCPASKCKFLNNSCIVVGNNLYEAIPSKGLINSSADCTSSIVQLDSKLSFEDDMQKLEKMEEFDSSADERSFNH